MAIFERTREFGVMMAIGTQPGRLTRLVGTVQDITERRQIQRALQKSEALLNETQQMARLGGWELDLSTSQVTWTDQVYRIHEVPHEFQPVLDNALAQGVLRLGERWEVRVGGTNGQRVAYLVR